MRRATPHTGCPCPVVNISIHALLAESDRLRLFYTQPRDISIHALLAESDARLLTLRLLPSIFLSTLSLRRATKHYSRMPARQKYFYPRSPCGERRNSVNAGRNPTHISIHALLAESDWYTRCRQSCRYISIHALLAESDFRSALPSDDGNISIHALLAESDVNAFTPLLVLR